MKLDRQESHTPTPEVNFYKLTTTVCHEGHHNIMAELSTDEDHLPDDIKRMVYSDFDDLQPGGYTSSFFADIFTIDEADAVERYIEKHHTGLKVTRHLVDGLPFTDGKGEIGRYACAFGSTERWGRLIDPDAILPFTLRYWYDLRNSDRGPFSIYPYDDEVGNPA